MAKTVPAARASHVGASVPAQQAAISQAERPTAFSIYPGNVMQVDPVTRKLSVSILNGFQIDNCLFAADSLASMLGFAQTSMPAAGSQVLVVYTPGQSYAISGVGSNIVDNPEAFSVPATGDIEFETINDPSYGVRRIEEENSPSGGYTPGKDILPGEKEYSNNMGVWLRMLINMAQLSAGELAKIEVGLMNDMVRIVDNYFAHHNVGGDKLIWAAGGKCVEEDHFTGYGFEAEGKLYEHEVLVPCDGNVVDTSAIEDPSNATGRWRKSTYIGFLGDMIHTWVSDPTTALSNYADGAERAGKYRCWVGADGMLMVQSVGGVHIQVSPRVVVPEVKHNWNDPEFDIEEAFSNLDKSFLKLWGNGKDLWRDLNVACWQMRSWARYITLWHSLERWNALAANSDYCKVTDEVSLKEEPAPTAKETDKEEVNPSGDTPYSGTAMLSIDPSGSITLLAGGTEDYQGTTSVIMNRGNVQIAAPGNIEIQCGGTLSFTAKNVSMKATDHIEIASLAGALWLKARSAWNALCEAGRMWLKSDYKSGEANDDYPVFDGEPPLPQESGAYSICIDAAEGRLALHGKEEVTAVTSGPSAPVLLKTSMPGSPVNIESAGAVDVYTPMGVSVSANYFACDTLTVLFDCISARIANTVLVTPASLEVGGLVRSTFSASLNGFIGGSSEYVGVPKDSSKVDPSVPIGDAEEKTYAELKGIVKDTAKRVENESIEEVWKDYTWHFNDWYVPAGDVDEWTSLKQPPMVTEKLAKDSLGAASTLCEVDWTRCGLQSSSTTTEQGSTPWPGSNCPVWVFGGDSLPSLYEQAFVEDGNPKHGGISNMKKIDYNFYVQQY